MLRQPLLTSLLLALCAAAHADWKPLADSAFGTMTYDPASVKTVQGRTQIQYRIDLPKPRQNAQGKSYSSATVTAAIDCKQQTISLVEMQTNAGQNGQGALVERVAVPAAAPEKIVSTSSNAQVYKAACGASALPVASPPAAAAPAQPANPPAPPARK